VKGSEEALAEVKEKLSGLSSLVVEPEHTSIELMRDEPVFRADKIELELTEKTVTQLVDYLRIPAHIRDGITMETLEVIMQELLPQSAPFTIIYRGKKAEQITREEAKYHRVVPERLIAVIDEKIPEAAVQRIVVGEDWAKLEVVSECNDAPVVVGDVVRAGVMVNFSPIGTVKPTVQSYVMRLVCLNGMSTLHSYDQYGAKYKGDGDESFTNWLGDRVVHAYGEFAHVVESCKKLQGTKILEENRALMLAGLLKQASLGKDIDEMIKADAIEDPPENEWDLVNLLTRATSHHVTDPLDIGWGMWIASKFASEDHHMKMCPACHRVVK